MAVGDVYRISTVFTVYTEPMINTFFYTVNTVGAGAPESALLTAWMGAQNGLYTACLSNNALAVSILAQKVNLPTAPVIAQSYATNGQVASAALPTQVATILTRKTGVAGKGGRGRVFMGAIPTSFVSGDTVTVAAAATYQSFGNGLVGNLTSGAWVFTGALWKRKIASALTLTAVNVNTALRTRRSRAVGTRFHRRKKHTVGSI